MAARPRHGAIRPEGPGQGWRERRRRRILEAAAARFAAQSYHLVTMDGVAAAAAVGKATLYRYFPSKEDLYVAIFDDTLANLAAALDEVAAGEGTAADRLSRMIELLVPTLGEHLHGFRKLDDGLLLVGERKRRLFRDRRHKITRRIEDLIVKGVEAGEFRPVDARLCAQMVIGMIWAGSIHLADGAARLASGLRDLLLNGVLASAGNQAPPA